MFEFESGHMLSKHPGRCKFPHGHSRRVEIVVASPKLDDRDMVCDFKALKLAISEFLDQFDHAMAINAKDPLRPVMQERGDRLVIFVGEDPTTEAMARRIYEHVASQLGNHFVAKDGVRYVLAAHLVIERVRVWETSTSWAEYSK
jgi:6-pyruvoyltetrahydropterin/6-carboxytetrahydropterin synthase